MNINEFTAMNAAAQRYSELVKFLGARSERNLEWDLTVIDAVLRDFHFIATPSAVSCLFNLTQQLHDELNKTKETLAVYERDIANREDAIAASGGTGVVLPVPEIVSVKGVEVSVIPFYDTVTALQRHGIDVGEEC